MLAVIGIKRKVRKTSGPVGMQREIRREEKRREEKRREEKKKGR